MEVVELEVRINNLYRNGRLYVFPDTDEMLLIRDKYQTVGTLEDQYHYLIEGETLDGLAYKYYSDLIEDSSKFWWILADANDVYDPFDLSPYLGTEILIPNLFTTLLKLQS